MHGVWAVARTLIRETLRMRFLVFFVIALTAIYTVGFALWIHSSTGPGNEEVQTFLGYSLRMTAWFLSLLTIFISIATVARDIKRKEIYTIACKPISRAQYLLGKLTGMAVLNFIMLAINGVLIYGITVTLARTEPQNPVEEARIKQLVLVARQGVQPPLPDVSAEANQMTQKVVEERLKSGDINDPRRADIIARRTYREVEKQLIMRQRAVPPSGVILWHFRDIYPRDPEGYVFIRYKYDCSPNPPGDHVNAQWVYGPEDPLAKGTAYDGLVTRDPARTVREFAVPAAAVSVTGDLYVAFRNDPSNARANIIFPLETGIEALYVAGNFETNILRAFGLLFIRMIFLAILGIAAGAWVSFPVAVLLVTTIYILGLASGFILEAVSWEAASGHAYAIGTVMQLFPKLAEYDPVGKIETGRLVSDTLFAQALLYLLLIKGSIVALIGYLVFRFRELARVIV